MAHDGGREAEQAGRSNQRDLLFGPRGQARRPAATSPVAQSKHDLGGDIGESRVPQDDGERGGLFYEQRARRRQGDRGWTAPHTGGAPRQGYTFEDSPQQRQPQQQQQLSWAEVRGTIDVSGRQQGLRSAYESVEVGRETLECLDDQKERLERSEMMLDSTRYAIERGARVLRGMNFWGRVRNAFSDEPQVPQDYRSSTAAGQGAAATAHRRAPDDSPVEGFVCPDCRINFDAADALVAHFGLEHTNAGAGADGSGAGGSTPSGVVGAPGVYPQDFAGRDQSGRFVDGGSGRGGSDDFSGNDVAAPDSLKDQLFGRRRDDEPGAGAMAGTSGGRSEGGEEGGRGGGGGVIAEQQAFMASQDAYLDSVGKAVAELGLLGRNIGASLKGQGDAIERVVVKTEESNDRAAFVTRKAARQAQSSKPKKPTFVMSVALQEASTGLFLTVTGDEVVLQETELRNVCRFDAWQRQDGIIGFKSDVTGRWLGQTFLGYLRVSGTSFGKNHEWQADLRRKETTMVCCSANWGAGGYLSVRPNPNNSSMSGAPSSLLPPHTTAAAAAAAAAAEDSHAALPAARRAELGLIDATLANKPRAAVFRVVDCLGYTPQPFVGGKLMRNPAVPPGGGGSETGSDGGGAGGGWGSGFKEEVGWNR